MDNSVSFQNGYQMGRLAQAMEDGRPAFELLIHPTSIDRALRIAAENGYELTIGRPIPKNWATKDGKEHITLLQDGTYVIQDDHDKILVSAKR